MALSDDIKTQAKALSMPALRERVQTAQIDCGMHNMRLDQLMASPDLNSAEIEVTTRAQVEACTWSAEGSAELQRRRAAEAKKPAPKPKPKPKRPATTTAPPPAPAATKKTPWGWIAGGVAAVGALALGLSKRAAIVRVVRQAPKKFRKGRRK